ncbi:MAG: ABC transporter substrate-binding protein [Candidatus Krumholzibacteriota bacterium]
MVRTPVRVRTCLWLLGHVLLVLSALGLAGCGPDDKETETGTPATDLAPVPGGTAVVALDMDPEVLNPLIYSSSTAGLVYSELHDGLTEMGDDLLHYPRIATGWEVAPDSLSVTYHLRPWRWSDGVPLTAFDVVTSFGLYKDPVVASPRRGKYRDVRAAVALDSATVRYELSRPLPDLLRRTWHHILPGHLVGHLDPAEIRKWELNHRPLSSGEFLLEDWAHNRSLSMVRNPAYPGRAALLDRVVFRILPEQNARLVALETGEVDFVDNIPPDAVRILEQTGRVRIAATGGRRFYYLQWNFTNPLFASAQVRKALSLAIDRNRMIETLLLGYGRPAIGPIPPALWNHHRDMKPDPYDPAQARRLLADAGWEDTDGDGVLDRDGTPFRFEILTKQGDPVRESGSVILRENLREVGVEVTILAMELAAGLDRLRAGRFDTYFGRLNANLYGDPSAVIKSTAVEEFNNGRFANPLVDSLLTVALRIPDRGDALPLWLEIQETLAQDPPAAYLFYPENLIGIGERLRDVRPHLLSPVNNLAEWWIAPSDRKYKTDSR